MKTKNKAKNKSKYKIKKRYNNDSNITLKA